MDSAMHEPDANTWSGSSFEQPASANEEDLLRDILNDDLEGDHCDESVLRDILNETDEDACTDSELPDDDIDRDEEDMLAHILAPSTDPSPMIAPTAPEELEPTQSMADAHELNLRGSQRLNSLLSTLGAIPDTLSTSTRSRVQSTSTELLKIEGFVSRDALGEGMPSALTVHSKFLAVGTNSGIVVVYDYFQAERARIVTPIPKGSNERVPVSTLSMSETHEWLLIGLMSGAIQVWNWAKGELLHTVSDSHECTVVHADFLTHAAFDKGQWLVSGDQSGVVNTIKVEKSFFRGYKHDKHVVVDGVTTGHVLAMEMLPNLEDSQLMNTMGIMAMCTEDPQRVTELGAQTCIVQLLPKPQILRQAERPAGVREGTVPYLAWTQGSKEGDIDASVYLAIGWGPSLDVVRLTCGLQGQINFSLVTRMQSGWHLCGVSFLSSDSLLVTSTKKQMRVLGFRPAHPVESRRLAEMEPMDTPVMVVKHPYYVNVYGEPQHSFHNSLGSSGQSLFVLGFDQVISVKILLWNVRVEALVAARQWSSALNLLTEFYEAAEKRSHGVVVGLARNRPLKATELCAYAPTVLQQYLGDAEIRAALQRSKQEAEGVIGEAIQFCLNLQLPDFLFGYVLEELKGCGHLVLFLQLLEPCVLNRSLSVLPLHVIQAYITEYTSSSKLRRVEVMLLCLDIPEHASEALANLCIEHSLYAAHLHVCARMPGEALGSLLAAVRSQLEEVQAGLCTMKNACHCTQVVLKWLEYLWAGRRFPTGEEEYLDRRRANDVLLCLFSTIDDALQLEALLAVDPKPTFAMLQHAMMMASSQQCHPTLQWCVDKLVEHVEAAELRELLWDLASELVVGDFLVLSYSSLAEMLMHLAQTRNTKMLAKALANVPADAYDGSKLLPILEEAQCFEALVVLHKAVSQPLNVIECMLALPEQTQRSREQLFGYMSELLEASDQSTTVHQAIDQLWVQLLELDQDALARFVLLHFWEQRFDLGKAQMQENEKHQFEYLCALVRVQEQSEEGRKVSADEVLHPVGVGRYLELLAKYSPERVYRFLEEHPDTYQLDWALEVCRRHELLDAEAYVQERVGNVAQALQLHLAALQGSVEAIIGDVAQDGQASAENALDAETEAKITASLRSAIAATVALCQRRAVTEPEQVENTWLALLDQMISIQLDSSAQQQHAARIVVGLAMQIVVGHMVDGNECEAADQAKLLQTVFRQLLLKHSSSRLEQHHCFIVKFLEHVQMDMEQKMRLQKVLQQDTFELHAQYVSRFKKGSYKPASEGAEPECAEVQESVPELESVQWKPQESTSKAPKAMLQAHLWAHSRSQSMESSLAELELPEGYKARALSHSCGQEDTAESKVGVRKPGSMRDTPIYAQEAIGLFD